MNGHFCWRILQLEFVSLPTGSWRTWFPVWDRQGTTSALNERPVCRPDEQVLTYSRTCTPGCLLPRLSLYFIHLFIHISLHTDRDRTHSHRHVYTHTHNLYILYIHLKINTCVRHTHTHRPERFWEGRDGRVSSYKGSISDYFISSSLRFVQ